MRFSGSTESHRLQQTFRILLMCGILVFVIAPQEVKKSVVVPCSSLHRGIHLLFCRLQVWSLRVSIFDLYFGGSFVYSKRVPSVPMDLEHVSSEQAFISDMSVDVLMVQHNHLHST